MADLPEGTVTFLFSDVEGSTRLLERDAAVAGAALARHHALYDDIVTRHRGVMFETVGDAVYAAFAKPSDAVGAALAAQRAMASEDWGDAGSFAVRISVHTGQVDRRGDHYFGPALFRAARLQALAHGGQTLLSGVTAGLVDHALPDGARLQDLGAHRLKDLTEPERVFQLVHPDLRERFPALRSLDAHPHNLPVQLTSLIGRESEVADVRRLLDEHRLVTVLGPGGIGKTRVALQVAAERVDAHRDGAFFVDLAVVRDPELVPGAIAAALDVAERPDQRIDRTLEDHLRDRDLLLVLDNLEQLQPAVGATVAQLLASAPDLRILATSRLPLTVRGEQRVEITSLDAGGPNRFDTEPPAAVTLFVQRARAAGAALGIDEETGPIVAAICRRLDGLPLAIELATARLRVFSLRQLHDRLARRLPLLTGGAVDLPERHRTLRGTIAWSVELLTAPQRRLFGRLSVFTGGFTLDAAEAVAGVPIDESLEALVLHSLVRRSASAVDEPRFQLLETIREHAAELLEADGDAELAHERHAAWLLDLVTPAFTLSTNADRTELYARIEAELANIRAALEWLHETGRRDELLHFVAMLGQFFVDHGPAGEGRDWIIRALAAPADGQPLARARALRFAWSLHSMRGDAGAADEAIAEAIRLFEMLGAEAERELGQALARQGNSFEVSGHIREARVALERAAEIARRHGDDVTRRRALVSLAHILGDDGDFEASERALTEVYEDAVRADDLMSLLVAGSDLATVRILLGRAADAIAPARAAVDATRRSGRQDPLPRANLALAQIVTGDTASGRATLVEGLELADTMGDHADVAALVSALASLEARDGDPSVGAWCHAAGITLAEQIGYERRDIEAAFEDAELALVRGRLSESEFADAWARGSAATIEAALAVLRDRLPSSPMT